MADRKYENKSQKKILKIRKRNIVTIRWPTLKGTTNVLDTQPQTTSSYFKKYIKLLLYIFYKFKMASLIFYSEGLNPWL